MKFIVVTIEWLSEHGIMPLPTMRKTKDGSKIIMHEDYLTPYLQKEESEVDAENPNGWIPSERYPHNSSKLNELLQSEEWAYSEEEAPIESADFIQVAAIRNLMTSTKAGIQTLNLSDNEALQVKGMYPQWSEFINKSLIQGMKVQYDDKLYKVRQNIATVLENQPPSIDTAALYEEINETHAGTLEDPIPYNNNMELFNGKYYSQDGVTYLCTRSTGQAVYHNLSELVGIYVEVVSDEKESFTL